MTLSTLQRTSSGAYDNAVTEKSPEQLQDEVAYLITLTGNDVCAECSKPKPEYASVTLGVFVCDSCSKLHRALGRSISVVKGLKEESWTQQDVEILQSIGNLKSKAKYEAYVPGYYKVPTYTDARVLCEQWVRAKYQRREFIAADPSSRPYERDYGPVVLWKQSGRGAKFEQCRFELTASHVLYFAKPTATKAKQTLPLEEIDLAFVPTRITGNQHLLQMTITAVPEKPEMWLVYSEDGMHIVQWLQAVRAAKLRTKRVTNPTLPLPKACQDLTCDISIEGCVFKTGPRTTDSWKRRWIILHGHKLIYIAQPQDVSVKGCVSIGTVFEGFLVMDGLPSERVPQLDGYGFVLKTPTRDFHLSCQSLEEKRRWLAALKHVTKQEQTRSR